MNYHRMLGPGDLPGDDSNPNSPNYDASRDEAIEELVEQYLEDPAKVREADDWVAGSMDNEHYNALERALADLSLPD